MFNFLIGFIIGGCVAIIMMCMFSINREEIHPKQLQVNIREGLKGKLPFFIQGSDIEITPWKDGSGVVRIVERR